MKSIIFILCIFSRFSFATSNREVVQKKVKDHMKEITSCYSASLKKNPEIEGKIVVDWEINDAGEVIKISVNGDKTTLNDSTLHSCITDKFKTWKFPPAPKGQIFAISYPFIFSK